VRALLAERGGLSLRGLKARVTRDEHAFTDAVARRGFKP
jgi:hypothetical protein